ncbi:hypothetical protein DNTS_025416 [Danionella cerebrum]|uniref:NADH dehydrogenase [ubiquinone] iron-sulfur protein 5 n=1 Tax=Danionella cerebrum TaxID=2873325 RepID=A0A553Q2Y4_9TELE|nr:hypothetical protein DNTS_025416 [Danionella translucida]
MPWFDKMYDIKSFDIDRWLLPGAKQPWSNASTCFAYQKEWIECSDGIGRLRAIDECKIEWEDFMECTHQTKTLQRLKQIRLQRDKGMEYKDWRIKERVRKRRRWGLEKERAGEKEGYERRGIDSHYRITVSILLLRPPAR